MTTDPEWPACLACAIVDRARERAGETRSGVCESCFARYCWSGSTLGINATQDVIGQAIVHGFLVTLIAVDVVRYDGPCPVSSTLPTMSECPTLKYSQPWVNTSQSSSCRLAQRVQSLQHHRRVVCTEPRRRAQCYRSRKRRIDTRSVKLGPEREHSVATTARDLSPRPKWACWREGMCRLSGCRKGRRGGKWWCSGCSRRWLFLLDLRGNAAIAEGDRVVGVTRQLTYCLASLR
ncbi:hypothetical protein EV363DRAFT_1315512 [Boletus edulis]|nr:hypothetical protein EV363DRAFT_1315512 [Boletus edulis]